MASSLGPLGIGEEPAVLTVRDGHIVTADGGLGPEWLKLLEAYGL